MGEVQRGICKADQMGGEGVLPEPKVEMGMRIWGQGHGAVFLQSREAENDNRELKEEDKCEDS